MAFLFSIVLSKFNSQVLESLILAQSERWRRGLGMQVERSFFKICKFSQEKMQVLIFDSGKRVSNT
jgi:hypothetical protein